MLIISCTIYFPAPLARPLRDAPCTPSGGSFSPPRHRTSTPPPGHSPPPPSDRQCARYPSAGTKDTQGQRCGRQPFHSAVQSSIFLWQPVYVPRRAAFSLRKTPVSRRRPAQQPRWAAGQTLPIASSRQKISHASARRNYRHRRAQKKGTVLGSLVKIGGDLLFHKPVQYHRRCRA